MSPPSSWSKSTDVFCNCVLSATVEVATRVGAMVTYFCQELVHQMTAQQGWVVVALLQDRASSQRPALLLTAPARLHTALTPAKSEHVSKLQEHLSTKYDYD
jgi:hypothetical protein